MQLTKRQLKTIIREAMAVSPEGKAVHKSYHDDMRLEDDIASIIMIDVLGYEPEHEELDRIYDAVQKILGVCKR